MLGTKARSDIGLSILVVLCLLLLQPQACLGLMAVGGSEPVQDGGWPLGSVEMANLPTRVGWWEGPPFGRGEWGFLYRCRATEEFNQALKAFASIRSPKLEVFLHDGPEHNHWLQGPGEWYEQPDMRIDWTFMVCNPESWHRHYNDPTTTLNSGSPNFRQPVAPPRLDVYVGGGSIVWQEVQLPEKLTVIDKRAQSAPVKPVGGGLARGDVYDMSTGKPIAGAEIILATEVIPSVPLQPRAWEEVMRGRTDDLGSFQIEKIPAGRYRISVRAEGYASREVGLYENAGNTYHELVAELARRASVRGVVTDLQGKPIPGAKVYAAGVLGIDGRGYDVAGLPSATSDDRGRFEIGSLPTGFTTLWCQAPSLHLTNSPLEVYPVPSVSIKLVMEGTGMIRGKVVDRNGNVPAREVHIEVRPVGEQLGKWAGSAKCVADGSFEVTGVPPGKYLVSANPFILIEGHDPDAVEASIEAGETVEVTIVHADR